MLVVALSPSHGAGGIAAKVAGIVLANISSGGGEVNFLALTHFYGTSSLAGWSSGTGGAGLLGAGAYALATTTFGFSVQATLLASALIPMGMLVSFFGLLPLGPLRAAKRTELDYNSAPEQEDIADVAEERAGLLEQPNGHAVSPAYVNKGTALFGDLHAKLLRARTLVVPYMLPLFLLYVAEYTINQGVAPRPPLPASRNALQALPRLLQHLRRHLPARRLHLALLAALHQDTLLALHTQHPTGRQPGALDAACVVRVPTEAYGSCSRSSFGKACSAGWYT